MSLRYAALLAPACAFTHPQQPRRIVSRRDYSSIDDVFDSVFDDAFDAWSPFGLSRRRDPWSQFGLSRRRSPLAQQFGQLKRLSQAFEEQLQRVDEDDFLADTPLGQRRQLETKEDAPATKDGDAPKAEGDEAIAPAAPRGYAYSWSSSSLTQNGETRTTVRKQYKDADGVKSFQERSLDRDGKKVVERSSQGFGEAEAKLSFEGVDDAKSFESAWATKPALPAAEAPAAEAPKTWAPEALKQTKEEKEELAADAEIAKLKAELKALRGDPLPPADYGTTQV